MCENKPIIMSLGYNCEASFRIEDYFGVLDSYLYSWSFEEDRAAFIQSLKFIDKVFSKDVKLQPDHMLRDEFFKIKFHPRYDIIPKQGEVSTEAYEKGLDELRSRIEHLKEKTKSVFEGKRFIIFIMKVTSDYDTNDNIEYIISVSNALKSVVSANFKLIVVMEKKTVTQSLLELQDDYVQIETLKKFAPLKHTDIMGDTKGWYRILSEVSMSKSDCYYSNLRNRKKIIYPQMIKNCLKNFYKIY